MAETRRTRIVILGAAGRDFHNFNVAYRDAEGVEVVAFTAAQIPGIADRRYPPGLAGPLYPGGIPIVEETGLDELLRREAIDQVLFAYSDVPHAHVMHLASRALAAQEADLILWEGGNDDLPLPAPQPAYRPGRSATAVPRADPPPRRGGVAHGRCGGRSQD